MKLLGERNWYLPRWLQWLPRFDLGESEAAVETQPTPVARRRPSRPRGLAEPRRSLFRPAIGALLVTAGVLGFLDARDVYDVSPTVALAAGFAVVAGSITLGAISKRRVRGLVPLGVVLVAASQRRPCRRQTSPPASARRDERPLDAAQLEPSYEFGTGDFTVDLEELAPPPGTTKVDVELGSGYLLIRASRTPPSRSTPMLPPERWTSSASRTTASTPWNAASGEPRPRRRCSNWRRTSASATWRSAAVRGSRCSSPEPGSSPLRSSRSLWSASPTPATRPVRKPAGTDTGRNRPGRPSH